MPEAKVTLVFQVPVSRVQAFINAMQARGEEMADQWRCPDVIKGDDLRCQLDRYHDGDLHVHDRFSWQVVQDPPKTVASHTHLWVTARDGENRLLNYMHCGDCGVRRPF